MTLLRSPIPPIDDDDDDRLIGRVLSRREVLALMGLASVGVVAAACAPGAIGSSGASATAGASASAAAVASATTGGKMPGCDPIQILFFRAIIVGPVEK